MFSVCLYAFHHLYSLVHRQVAVAVKTLKTGSTVEEKIDFLSEADMMKRFDHRNVVKLLGVCTRNEPVYTVMEFMLYGDLKTYLLARSVGWSLIVERNLPLIYPHSPSHECAQNFPLLSLFFTTHKPTPHKDKNTVALSDFMGERTAFKNSLRLNSLPI